MNIRNAHSYLARAFAGAALAASIVGSVSPASAVTCTIPYPSKTLKPCQQGSSFADITHFQSSGSDGLKFNISVNMKGGSVVAVAYGIDVNGNHLNTCATTVADDDPNPGRTSAVSCAALYGTSGSVISIQRYNHPNNMASTFVSVL
jgi:hypothetical protein